MKIIETQIMRGPNLWSHQHHRLIVLTVDAGNLTADQSAMLYERGARIIPGLPHNPAALVEAIIKLMLSRAGMPCSYSRTEHDRNGSLKIIFSYTVEQAGVIAAQEAITLLSGISDSSTAIDDAVARIVAVSNKEALGATSAYILHEAERRGIPCKRFNSSSLFTLGYGKNQKMIRTAVADSTSGLGIEMAGDKEETKQLLAAAFVPVPKGLLVKSEQELEKAIGEVRFPIVTKPLDGNHGRGVTTQIHTAEQALFGFRIAQQISETVIVEEYIEGDDYRFLVINYKLVAVARRTPAMVTGNGSSTIRQLIDEANLNPERGWSSEHVLAPIVVDKITEKILHEKSLTLDSVLPQDAILYLKETANISAGGTAEDVTDKVHPYTVFMVERMAQLFKLNICGIDIMTTDISAPLTRDTGAVIEVNAGPGIRMHTNPQAGKPRNVAAPIIDMLFPTPDTHRIPVVAVTGTNGKTTTTRLIAHFAKQAGYTPGYTTTDGIYINGNLLVKGDCTGPSSAKSVLFDPTVDFAVLECARGGILRSGLGFDKCDVSIITNISEDHLGLKGIHTLEDMLRVKAVVAYSTDKNGYAILNAEDPLVYSLYDKLSCQVALFSLTTGHEGLLKHIENGGVAAVLEDDFLVIYDGKKVLVEQIDCVPLTHEGKARHMIKNMLAATLAAYLCRIDLQAIQDGLRSFRASAEQTPGRMNLFKFRHCDLMIDYAHNVDGFREIKKYVDTLNTHKTGIISVAGDRRDQDIRAIGRLAAETFDRIIIRHDKDLRGRSSESLDSLLLEGIRSVKPELQVTVIPAEEDAIRYALQHAPEGGFILECVDEVHAVLSFVKSLQEQESVAG